MNMSSFTSEGFYRCPLLHYAAASGLSMKDRKITVFGAGSSATKTVQSFINTKGHEQSLHIEQKDRGNTGDFLTLVTKDQSHEYLKWCHQMKSPKVWQVASKLDEESFY